MWYFTRLLGVDGRSLRPTVSQERPHAFFFTNSAVQNARPSLVINERPLDYAISQVGTVVPQRMYSSGGPTEARRCANVSLNLPVFFVLNDRVTLGLALARPGAVGGDRATLLGAGDAAPVGNGSSLYVRINVSIFPLPPPPPSMITRHYLECVLLKLVLGFSGLVTSNGIRRSGREIRRQLTTQLLSSNLPRASQTRWTGSSM
jgi:hypothetical protein